MFDKVDVNHKCTYCSRKLTLQMDREEYQQYLEFIEDGGEITAICGVCEENGLGKEEK